MIPGCDSTIEARFWEKVNKDGPVHPELGTRCWIWTAASHPLGYGLIGKGGGRKKGLIRATHVSWWIHFGHLPGKQWVLHTCDNPPCVNSTHLKLGDSVQNVQDCITRGRFKFLQPRYGLENVNGKLTDEQITEIFLAWQEAPKRRHGRVAYREALAKKYHVSVTAIKMVVNGTVRRKKKDNDPTVWQKSQREIHTNR